MKRAALLALQLGLAFAASSGCSAEHQPALTHHECKTNQFRACDTDTCHGVQQCLDPGYWSDCSCVILDASYADSETEASDAGPESASDASDASDATDAEDGGDGDADGD